MNPLLINRQNKIYNLFWRISLTDEPHHHHHESSGELPFNDKLNKILNHWIKHNADHASNYRNWAEKAKANDMEKAGILLEEAADMSLAINEKLEAALELADPIS